MVKNTYQGVPVGQHAKLLPMCNAVAESSPVLDEVLETRLYRTDSSGFASRDLSRHMSPHPRASRSEDAGASLTQRQKLHGYDFSCRTYSSPNVEQYTFSRQDVTTYGSEELQRSASRTGHTSMQYFSEKTLLAASWLDGSAGTRQLFPLHFAQILTGD